MTMSIVNMIWAIMSAAGITTDCSSTEGRNQRQTMRDIARHRHDTDRLKQCGAWGMEQAPAW